jgi:hypothetical protein
MANDCDFVNFLHDRTYWQETRKGRG